MPERYFFLCVCVLFISIFFGGGGFVPETCRLKSNRRSYTPKV